MYIWHKRALPHRLYVRLQDANHMLPHSSCTYSLDYSTAPLDASAALLPCPWIRTAVFFAAHHPLHTPMHTHTHTTNPYPYSVSLSQPVFCRYRSCFRANMNNIVAKRAGYARLGHVLHSPYTFRDSQYRAYTKDCVGST